MSEQITNCKHLKPCPFCGSEAQIYQYHSRIGNMWKVRCRKCGVYIEAFHRKTVVELWDRRAETKICSTCDYNKACLLQHFAMSNCVGAFDPDKFGCIDWKEKE